MVEEKLVHPIVTARTLPRGDRRKTNTHTHAEKKKNILAFLYMNTDVFTPVSVTLLKMLVFTFLQGDAECQRFRLIVTKWQTKLCAPTPLNSFFSRVNRNTRTQSV